MPDPRLRGEDVDLGIRPVSALSRPLERAPHDRRVLPRLRAVASPGRTPLENRKSAAPCSLARRVVSRLANIVAFPRLRGIDASRGPIFDDASMHWKQPSKAGVRPQPAVAADALARGQLVRPSISRMPCDSLITRLSQGTEARQGAASAAGSSLRPGRVRAPALPSAPRTQDVVTDNRRAMKSCRKSRKAHFLLQWTTRADVGGSLKKAFGFRELRWLLVCRPPRRPVIARDQRVGCSSAASCSARSPGSSPNTFSSFFSAYAAARMAAAPAPARPRALAASSDAGDLPWLFVPWWERRPSSASPRSPLRARVSSSRSSALGDTLTLVHYEVTHLAAHVPITTHASGSHEAPPSFHHFKNERYWFGVTNPVFDLLLATWPIPTPSQIGDARRSHRAPGSAATVSHSR